MLSQISVSVTSGNFSVVGSVHFSVLYIVTLYMILLHHSRLRLSIRSHYSKNDMETMLSTALGFPIHKRVADHCSILTLEAIGFSQVLLPP